MPQEHYEMPSHSQNIVNKKTCHKWQQGDCRRGNHCKYEHSEPDPLLNHFSDKSGKKTRIYVKDQLTYKLKLCWHLKKAEGCRSGLKCAQAHFKDEQRQEGEEFEDYIARMGKTRAEFIIPKNQEGK